MKILIRINEQFDDKGNTADIHINTNLLSVEKHRPPNIQDVLLIVISNSLNISASEILQIINEL